jgi:RNA polymerase sigma-70 factor (ECF subfamily)
LKPDPALDPSKPCVEESPARTIRSQADLAEERTLVERARNGESEAFRSLVELHQNRAYGLALRIVRSASDAEEVAQDAFVRAWQGLGSFRGDAAFSTWMYRIVARVAFDRAALLKARRDRETEIESLEDLPVVADNPGRGPDADRIGPVLERLIRRLPDVQRAAVTLYYYEDRSVERVAQTLDLPIGTVKTHLSRARTALRGMWTRENLMGPR